MLPGRFSIRKSLGPFRSEFQVAIGLGVVDRGEGGRLFYGGLSTLGFGVVTVGYVRSRPRRKECLILRVAGDAGKQCRMGFQPVSCLS